MTLSYEQAKYPSFLTYVNLFLPKIIYIFKYHIPVTTKAKYL